MNLLWVKFVDMLYFNKKFENTKEKSPLRALSTL